MIRQNLRAALCLAAFTAPCALAAAQNTPGDTAQPPAESTAPSDTQSAPAIPGQPEPAPSTPDYLPSSLTYQIGALLEDPAVARDHWGILVTNLDGSLIYGLNQAQLFQPASNAKLFTTAAALTLLGPTKTFHTVVAITAPVKKGVLHGNLYLVGGGDANFGAQDIPYLPPADRPKTATPPQTGIPDIDNLADQVIAKGIRRIEGDILGDDSLYKWRPYPPDWSWDDLVWGYGAPVSALTIHDNEMQMSASSGSNAVVPDLPYYSVSNRVSIASSSTRDCDSLRFSRFPGSKDLTIEGALPDKAQPCPENIAINDPAEYAAMALKAALEQRGVRVSGSAIGWHNDAESGVRSPVSVDALPASAPAPKSGDEGCIQTVSDGPNVNVIAQHSSPPLSADVNFANKVSQNLHAELMLRNIAQLSCDESGNYPIIIRQFLIKAGIDPNDFIFYDGSGLSSHDLVTPRATAKLLQFATTQPWFAAWKASLPIGGEDGTLENRFPNPPLKDHLFAKTGTLGEARALSGYLDAASGRTVIFSVMVGNHLPGTTADRDVMDKIVAAIQAAE